MVFMSSHPKMHTSMFLSIISLILLGQALGHPASNPSRDVAQFFETYKRSSLERWGVKNRRRDEDKEYSCTEGDIRVRKSWVDLSLDERKEYIDAVKCLRQKPALTPLSLASGARNRMDDFTIAHAHQTHYIHVSGWFMPWHRYFVWQYETALRDECGYSGYQPYWDWTQYNDDLSQHPLFDGSEYSLGGNGVYVPHGTLNGTIPGVPEPQVITRPPGTGGGCVVDGPFANATMSVGRVFPGGNPNRTGLEYTPHCLTRDFLNPLSQQVLTNTSVAALLSQTTMNSFLRVINRGVPPMTTGVHPAGHSAVGGDLNDVFTSPQEPAFFLHHAQIDRLWTIWQEQAPGERLYAMAATRTWANSPPSGNATIWDTIKFLYAGGDIIVASVQDAMSGKLCYRYE